MQMVNYLLKLWGLILDHLVDVIVEALSDGVQGFLISRSNVGRPVWSPRWLHLFSYPGFKIIFSNFHFFLGFVLTSFELSTWIVNFLKVLASYKNVICWIPHKRFSWNVINSSSWAVKRFDFRIREGAIISIPQWVVPDLVRNSLLGVEFCKSKSFSLVDSLYMDVGLIYNTLPLIRLD